MINQSLFIPFPIRDLLQESILCSGFITMLVMQERDLPNLFSVAIYQKKVKRTA